MKYMEIIKQNVLEFFMDQCMFHFPFNIKALIGKTITLGVKI